MIGWSRRASESRERAEKERRREKELQEAARQSRERSIDRAAMELAVAMAAQPEYAGLGPICLLRITNVIYASEGAMLLDRGLVEDLCCPIYETHIGKKVERFLFFWKTEMPTVETRLVRKVLLAERLGLLLPPGAVILGSSYDRRGRSYRVAYSLPAAQADGGVAPKDDGHA